LPIGIEYRTDRVTCL